MLSSDIIGFITVGASLLTSILGLVLTYYLRRHGVTVQETHKLVRQISQSSLKIIADVAGENAETEAPGSS